MWQLLKTINQHLVVAIPCIMFLGFGFGLAYDPSLLKRLIVPLTFVMVYPMMVTLKIKEVLAGGDTRAQLLAQLINFGIVPFVAFGVGIYCLPDRPYMALGLLLAGLVPTSGMTISWTGLARGNMAAAVKMTVIGLTLGSLATPLYVQFLLGAQIAVDMAAVVRQILLIVFLPMAAGFATQQLLIKKFGRERFQKTIGPRFPMISLVGVLGIVFVAMALKAQAIANSPQILAIIILPLLIVYALNFGVSTLTGRLLLSRGDAIALVYGTVMRNLSIALAIAINAFGERGADAALVVALAYIIQVQSAAWYVKYTDRIFGTLPHKSLSAPKSSRLPDVGR
ncbi:MAG: bile acid:sodium symporter [Desulfobacterales bacterium]|jgi:ACR3 family arsenite efflux pump ArsB